MKFNYKTILSLVLTCMLSVSCIFSVSSASAVTNSLSSMEYKYWWRNPGIGAVHWHYSEAYLIGYKSLHYIVHNNPDGTTGRKYGTWQNYGGKSSAGLNLLGGQLESWGIFAPI